MKEDLEKGIRKCPTCGELFQNDIVHSIVCQKCCYRAEATQIHRDGMNGRRAARK